jgi:hypothetical protein
MLLGLTLNLAGAGLGLAAFSPDIETVKSVSLITLIWMFGTGLISMYVGGWISTALGGATDKMKGYWQGIIMPGVACC